MERISRLVGKKKNEFLPFSEAREYAHSLGLKSIAEWQEYCKSRKPKNIPFNPDKTYENKGWKGFGDWLGTGVVATQDREYLSFEQARDFVRALGITNVREWEKYRTFGNKPKNIPSMPNRVYKGWISWGDWLGTERISNRKRKFWPPEQAREFVRALGLKDVKEWEQFRKSKNRPSYIPTNPRRTYQKEWKGWSDWLGTDTVQNQKKRVFAI